MSDGRSWKETFIRPLQGRLFSWQVPNFYFWTYVYRGKYHNWLRENRCEAYSDRRALWEHVASSIDPDRAIDYLEFGVYKGESIRWWLARNSHPDSTFTGFDTFTGLPEDWSAASPAGTFSTGGTLPVIEDSRCRLRAGLFQDTLPGFLRDRRFERRLVVHLDADLYSSTLYVLCQLAPHLSPGTILIFDEFVDVLNEFRALLDFLSAFRVKVRAIGRTPVVMGLEIV